LTQEKAMPTQSAPFRLKHYPQLRRRLEARLAEAVKDEEEIKPMTAPVSVPEPVATPHPKMIAKKKAQSATPNVELTEERT
jgi:hypothetical protein